MSAAPCSSAGIAPVSPEIRLRPFWLRLKLCAAIVRDAVLPSQRNSCLRGPLVLLQRVSVNMGNIRRR